VRGPERTGLVGFGGTRAGGRAIRALGVLAILGLSLVLAPAANASTNFTWAGGSTATENWTALENWEGGVAPIAAEGIGTLTFPRLTSFACEHEPKAHPCYISFNDVSGLSAESLQIDDGDDYLIGGEELTLGSGGLSAAPAGGASGPAGDFVELPLQLSASQKWSIADRSGDAIEENGLFLEGALTGSPSALTVELSNGSALFLDNDTEVGPVTIEGSVATGEHIKENGAVLLEGGDLNSSDRQAVDLRQVFFGGTGAVGALAMNSATLDVGSETEPAEGLETSSVKLDSTSGVIFEIMGSGTTAQVDYSQLVSDGPVELSGEIGVVVGKPTEKASCPVLTAGQKYTFLSTAGTLSGSFADAPESGPEISIDFSKSCSHSPQAMRIGYNRSGGTETVTGTVEEEAVNKKHNEEAAIESAKREAERIAAKTEGERQQQAREHEEQKAKETAAIYATEAAALKRREEEDAAAQATGSVLLNGSSITVRSSGEAVIKLACAGTGRCSGKLTLTVKGTTKRGEKAKTETIGTATFSIPPNETRSIKLTLNAAGRALLSADHGHLGATLSVLKSSPAPSQTHTDSVHLVQQKAHGKAKK